MRIVVIVLIILCPLLISGQIKSNIEEIIVEYSNIFIGESLEFEDYEIHFDNVVSDSRCPKEVICVVAGEAIINLTIYKSGELLSKKELIFTPITYFPNQKGNLFERKDLKVSGVELWPYPKAGHPIPSNSYKLKLLVEELID